MKGGGQTLLRLSAQLRSWVNLLIDGVAAEKASRSRAARRVVDIVAATASDMAFLPSKRLVTLVCQQRDLFMQAGSRGSARARRLGPIAAL